MISRRWVGVRGKPPASKRPSAEQGSVGSRSMSQEGSKPLRKQIIHVITDIYWTNG
ncbi:hypothetical protein FACS189418_8570 [Clostridia bacterium]|nr:hypothetical protein FACS189418_8570 [Clostridia bacterium]